MIKTSKRISILTAIALILSCVIMPCGASALSSSDPQDGYYFENTQMQWVLCDENGNVVQEFNPNTRVSYGSVDIPNGYTMYFQNSGNPFQLLKASTVSFKVSWSSNAQYIMGYDVGNKGSGTVTTLTVTTADRGTTNDIIIPKTAGYIFWVTNMSTDTKTLSSARITNT